VNLFSFSSGMVHHRVLRSGKASQRSSFRSLWTPGRLANLFCGLPAQRVRWLKCAASAGVWRFLRGRNRARVANSISIRFVSAGGTPGESRTFSGSAPSSAERSPSESRSGSGSAAPPLASVSAANVTFLATNIALPLRSPPRSRTASRRGRKLKQAIGSKRSR
jgi:hypothetical protein